MGASLFTVARVHWAVRRLVDSGLVDFSVFVDTRKEGSASFQSCKRILENPPSAVKMPRTFTALIVGAASGFNVEDTNSANGLTLALRPFYHSYSFTE